MYSVGQHRHMHSLMGPPDPTVQPTMPVHTWFVQKVSGLTTVLEVDKAYGVLTQIFFNIVPLGNILQTPLLGCLIVSSSNFV